MNMDDAIITAENPSESGQTDEEDDILKVPRRDYSEIKAEWARTKRFNILLDKVEAISRSLDLGSNTEEPTIMEDSIITRFDSTPSYIANGQLRDYQLQGLNWLISLQQNGVNGLVADEMGLGKTLQVIALLGYMKHYRKSSPKDRHIVIAPKSTMGNWKNEFEKWCPSIKVLEVHGEKFVRKYLLRKFNNDKSWDVCLTTYETVLMEKYRIRKFKWCYLVIDESGRIKNEKSKLSTVIRGINSSNRLLLTGVPLQNNLHELWALLNFLVPNVFDSSEDFDAWFNVENCLENTSIVQRLHAILRPFYLRRLKSDVEKAIPPKKEIKIYVSLSRIEKERYAQILAHETDNVFDLYESYSKSPFAIFTGLRKCCNHPFLFRDLEPGPPYVTDMHLVNVSGKMRVLDKLLIFLRDQGSRILLFSQFRIMLDVLEDYMRWRKFPYYRLDGETKHEDRTRQICNFNTPGCKRFIFLLTTRAGGLGINLASADVVIFYDSDFNPHWDLQAMDRAHRIGQKKTVRVFRLIAENTIEERMLEIAETKLQLENTVLEKGRKRDLYCSKISRNEIIKIMRYGADHIIASKDTEIADEDIESILEKSEKKTQEKQTKLKLLGESTFRRVFCDATDDYQESLELSKRNCTVTSENYAKSRNLQLESMGESTLENFSSNTPENDQVYQKDAEKDNLIQLSKQNCTVSSDNVNSRNLPFESMGESNLENFSSNAPENDQVYQNDAGIKHLIQRSKRKRSASSDNDGNSRNHQLESIEESPLENFPSGDPGDYQECQKDAGIKHLSQRSKRKHSASFDNDINSGNHQLESMEKITLEIFSSDNPKNDQECQKLPKRKRTASYDIDPKSRDLIASTAKKTRRKEVDQELKQKNSRIQKHENPKSLKIPSKQKSERNKRNKILKSIETSENVDVSTNSDKDITNFSSLRNICMDHLKRVVQTAIQFQRHSHSRRLCTSHFSKALTTHGFHFEYDFSEDFQDYYTSEMQR